MADGGILEGTGEELQRHHAQHPTERFYLVPLGPGRSRDRDETTTARKAISPSEELRILDELAELGKRLSRSFAGESYSRQTIYSEHD